MNEPDFLTHAVGELLRVGASTELVDRFRRAYTGGRHATRDMYPCPLCFLNRNKAEYMNVVPKPPASKRLQCACCKYEISVTSPSRAG